MAAKVFWVPRPGEYEATTPPADAEVTYLGRWRHAPQLAHIQLADGSERGVDPAQLVIVREEAV